MTTAQPAQAWPRAFELVLWHRYFDGDATDHSGFGNSGRIEGPERVEGRSPGRSALAFDGVDDRIVVPPSPSLSDLGALRLTVGLCLEQLGGRRTVVEGSESFSFLFEPDGILEGAIYNGSRWESVRSKAELLELGRWVDVTYIYDGQNTSALYVGNERVALNLRPLGRIESMGWPFGLNIGAWPNGDKRVFKGRIDEVRLWRGARTTS